MSHIPVFKKEIIANLEIKPRCNYADLTLGGGGHSWEIWSRITLGVLISFDLDLNAIEQFKSRPQLIDKTWKEVEDGIWYLNDNGREIYLCHQSFENLAGLVKRLGIGQLHGAIADLGWADEQLDGVSGLSYSRDPQADLDMRLRSDMGVKAADLLNGLYREELKTLFTGNADITGKLLDNLVDAILQYRKHQSVARVEDLLKIINSVSTSATHRGSEGRNYSANQKFARNLPARVFQALRIAVNHELSTLQSLLNQCLTTLAPGAILEIITFHSGEEKLVSNYCERLVSEAAAEYVFKTKYLLPSVSELRENLRARSAKLFALKIK